MDFSAGQLLASLFVSAVGFGFFHYGRKQTRPPQLVTGLALMVYPYFIASPGWILGIGAALVVVLWLAVCAGM